MKKSFLNSHKNLLRKLPALSLTILMALSLSSCMYDKPDPNCHLKVALLIHSDTQWTPDYDLTIPAKASTPVVEYIIKIFNAGTTQSPVFETILYQQDLSRPDISENITLNSGNYDVYVWSDLCGADSKKSLFYNASDFAAITYLTPYQANSNNKDAFRGNASFSVKAGNNANVAINLQRPLARYQLIATDLEAYPNLEETLADYSVTVTYPMFMPAVFDNFLNKPVNSWSNISFTTKPEVLDNKTVALGMDYVFVNSGESNVQLAVDVRDGEGNLTGSSTTLNVPLLRDRTTLVSGAFLTTKSGGSVVIDPDFEGHFDIEWTQDNMNEN